MAALCTLALSAAPAPVLAWSMPVHRALTAAAIRTLPSADRAAWGVELDRLAQDYCTYPDLYAGLTGPRHDELRPYNEIDGRPVHNITWNRRDDLETLARLRRSIAEAAAKGDYRRAGLYAGTLVHFIEDSLSPAHALTPWDSPLDAIKDLVEPPPEKRDLNLHAVLEASAPPVDLGARAPRRIDDGALLDAIYQGVRRNREVLLDLARAAYAGDREAMAPALRQAATLAAQLVADALFSAR